MSYRDLRGPITAKAAARERDQLFDRPARAISPELVALFKRIADQVLTAPAHQPATERIKPMATLNQELERLDNQIAAMRAQREASHDNTERAKLQRQIDMLNVHERAAIKQVHADRAAKRAAEEKAAEAYQQHQADQQEAQDRAMLRRRWTGDEASFTEAWPDLIKQLRMDRALGRDVGSDVIAPRVAF
jgi:hypothetical protein